MDGGGAMKFMGGGAMKWMWGGAYEMDGRGL